jgi:endo-1,4-beta-xylanase
MALRYRALRCKAIVCTLLFAAAAGAAEPGAVYLWPNGAPGSEGKTGEEVVRVTGEGERIVRNVHKPSLTLYLPSKQIATGAAVIIAPGGGHREMWTDHEGHNAAKWLSEHGIAGFVLKYRLAREQGSTYAVEQHSLDDTQRAIRLVRHRAAEWGVDPGRIGVMGFSAGGQLAALAAVRYDVARSDTARSDGGASGAGSTAAADPVDKHSSKPAFQALIYPAIPRDMPLTKETPPAFLLCGENDRENISQGLPELYLALKRAGVSAELHVYAGVGHGFGMRERTKGPVADWVTRFREWMDASGFLKP